MKAKVLVTVIVAMFVTVAANAQRFVPFHRNAPEAQVLVENLSTDDAQTVILFYQNYLTDLNKVLANDKLSRDVKMERINSLKDAYTYQLAAYLDSEKTFYAINILPNMYIMNRIF
ncbi:MAG: hypothetical protein MJY71_06040 [Bacteroidaceae bacterium]|nr:hypothetical protein [Bacteroidaceae bacterium]MCQ2059375.1 hypothetical protein [Bacteroidaceae bacterium]